MKKQAKLKKPEQLTELLKITRKLLEAESERRKNARDERNDPSQYDTEVDFDKLRQIKEVLEEGQHFSGINRFGREKRETV